MLQKAFVLLSGGIDSTTCLHMAMNEADDVEAVSIDYGQRHIKESEYARETTDYLGIPHVMIHVPGIFGPAMLTDKSMPIPSISYSEIKGVSPTYVPFRNGTLLSLITAHAQKWVNKITQEHAKNLITKEPISDSARMDQATRWMQNSVGIYFGAHAEDAANWAYPDCTPEFIGAMANAIFIGSYQAIRLHTPLQWLNKYEIIRRGSELGVNWSLTWSCYKGEDVHCGTCPTCRARKEGFRMAGVADPTIYAQEG